ncbi:hypothetical protein OOK31_03610 [Streptomyces sp. NBC_00249]|uniref:hypothetical protein n=1 Tax=Streptomyces sp. NBC_00249 TaxID=2975690 RepID=UPI00225B890F|nr:hypothetical protein [Streptomyces sp. NBC_00249]MCX5192987.1 hypothetical protein [Streptomyces sp. NBC_00249]
MIAAVETDHSAFEVSEEALPRVLSLLRLFAERAFALHGEIKVSKKRKQPRPPLTVHGITYEISSVSGRGRSGTCPSSRAGGRMAGSG